ncbi:sigma-54 interaction domain-containing protein [Thermosediminibacter oceani]|uniref:PAS modulated sigma54 specific transcriptional regulator, Fis family n=1 Tax=Thermosediminibacter oceani (strain ATCC BAA-1034 / DSM 16646 / JW/IW-1228P) TaxID=555079 RepID=D9RY17_THEOJ|nr:PAS modulated sigma54 specific transcriptional regulator, Fis family [Thermosediminibacter oceani DSM 16646]
MSAEFLNEFYDEILNSLDVGIHIVDREGNTVFYNAAMGRLERLDPDAVIGKKLLEVFPSLNRETSTLFRVLKTGEAIVDRVQTYFNYRGQRITTINTTLPLKKGNKIMGAVEIAKDITKLREMAEKVVFLQDSTKIKVSREMPHPFTRFTFEDIIGESPAITKAIHMARKASMTSSSVLIFGETGTGKELFAHSIHNASPRKGRPFIAQNCAALPESLLEGILFGTVKGSFTGAVDRPGLFEQAHGGTLLLDEINSMGINLQAKLLRVLQEGCVRRIGDTRTIPVNVRIIATTNEDPLQAVEKGILRKDLFFRLGVVCVKIPPLRERKEDIILLTRHFIDKFNKKLNRNVIDISPAVKRIFMEYNWPGNVRELENVIEGSMNMIGDESLIEEEHLPFYITDYLNRKSEKTGADLLAFMELENYSLDEILSKIEKEIIKRTIKECNGNVTKAADRLKVKRQTLQYRMRRLNME